MWWLPYHQATINMDPWCHIVIRPQWVNLKHSPDGVNVLCWQELNSLAPGRSLEFDSQNVIFNLVLLIGIFRSPRDNALRWMPHGLTNDQSTLVQVMAWCRQATSHYLNQCWPRPLPPYGITRPQWVKKEGNLMGQNHHVSFRRIPMKWTSLGFLCSPGTSIRKLYADMSACYQLTRFSLGQKVFILIIIIINSGSMYFYIFNQLICLYLEWDSICTYYHQQIRSMNLSS